MYIIPKVIIYACVCLRGVIFHSNQFFIFRPLCKRKRLWTEPKIINRLCGVCRSLRCVGEILENYTHFNRFFSIWTALMMRSELAEWFGQLIHRHTQQMAHQYVRLNVARSIRSVETPEIRVTVVFPFIRIDRTKKQKLVSKLTWNIAGKHTFWYRGKNQSSPSRSTVPRHHIFHLHNGHQWIAWNIVAPAAAHRALGGAVNSGCAKSTANTGSNRSTAKRNQNWRTRGRESNQEHSAGKSTSSGRETRAHYTGTGAHQF